MRIRLAAPTKCTLNLHVEVRSAQRLFCLKYVACTENEKFWIYIYRYIFIYNIYICEYASSGNMKAAAQHVWMLCKDMVYLYDMYFLSANKRVHLQLVAVCLWLANHMLVLHWKFSRTSKHYPLLCMCVGVCNEWRTAIHI